MLQEYDTSYFNKENVLHDLDLKLKSDEQRLSEFKGDSGSILSICKKSLENSIGQGKLAIEKMKTIGDRDIVEFVLSMNEIRVSEDKEDDSITLEYDTIMHNDFTDGMNNLLKEIVLYFVFDSNHKVICKRTSDQLE
jgi:hypothetical protein